MIDEYISRREQVCYDCFCQAVKDKLDYNPRQDFNGYDIYDEAFYEDNICPHYEYLKDSIPLKHRIQQKDSKIKKLIPKCDWGSLPHFLPIKCPKFFSHLSLTVKERTQKLNKEACKICVKKRNNGLWHENDEKLWNVYGKVRCKNSMLLSVDTIPEKCIYKLEHLIENSD